MSDLSTEIRIKLEGRLEVLEAALGRYRDLERVISGNWRRRAIEARDRVLAFLAEEPAVDDAVAHALRLAGAKPGAVLTELEAYRSEIAGRLGLPAWKDAAAALKAAAESVRLPGAEEVVVLHGTAERRVPMWALVSVPSLVALIAIGPLAAAGVLVSTICLGLAVIPLGTYALMADRLVWVPHTGVPRQLPIDALTAIEVAGRGIALTTKDGGFRLPAVDSAAGMALLLLLYRDGPLKGVARPPAGTSMVLAATLASGATAEGFALLHPGGLCFLARGTAAVVCSRLVARADLDVSERFLLEQLSRIEAEALAPLLAGLADVDGVVHAPAGRVNADPIRGGKLRLRVGMALVDLSLSGVDAVALTTLLPWTKAP